MNNRKKIGTLLVDAGIISAKTLERTLKIQQGSGKRLGMLLSEMGIVTEEEVVEALSLQFNLKKVMNFANHSFPRELLDLVPARLALEKTIFPLKHNGSTLAIASVDPFDRETFSRLEKKTGMQIYLVLSTREEIITAIEKHYKIKGSGRDQRQKILLIDDSPVFIKVLNAALENEGFEVIVASDGVDGMKQALMHHPDLILCDLFMPRMDGYKFMQAKRGQIELSDIPVILVTSKASKEEEQKALEVGFADFIGKPVLPPKVIERIRNVLSSEQGTRQAAI